MCVLYIFRKKNTLFFSKKRKNNIPIVRALSVTWTLLANIQVSSRQLRRPFRRPFRHSMVRLRSSPTTPVTFEMKKKVKDYYLFINWFASISVYIVQQQTRQHKYVYKLEKISLIKLIKQKQWDAIIKFFSSCFSLSLCFFFSFFQPALG